MLGKPIHALAIGRGKKKIMLNASHHANEWLTTHVLTRFLEDLCAGRLPAAEEILTGSTIYMVPMVNPDGVDLVLGAPESADLNNWKANIRGVDLNVNYPAGWETAKRLKAKDGYTKPGPIGYPGAYPLSEPETRAMVNFTRDYSFDITLSYHTQGEVIYWRYADYDPPRAFELAALFSKASGYVLEDTPLASSHGGYKDWFIQSYNRPGFTIECGMGENPLLIGQLDKIYRDNKNLITAAAKM